MTHLPTVIHIVQRMAPGGIETLVSEFIRAAPDLDGRVISLEGAASDLILGWPRLGDIEERLTALDKRPGFDPTLVARLAGVLRARRPTAVLCHGIGPLLYGGLAARIARVPVRLQIEHDGWSLAAPRRAALHRLGVRLANSRLVAVSVAVRDVLATLHPGRTVEIIGNGIDMERFRPADRLAARRRVGLPVGAPLIGAIGRLERVKGHDVLIDALARLDGVHLALVGGGSEAEALRERVRRNGLGGRVHFLGHRDDTADLLPCFDVFCLPSRAEGLPLAVLEAQAVGLPVVASAVGGVPQALHPEASDLVPAEDVGALALALVRRLARPADAAGPRAFVQARYSLRATLAAYRALILQSETAHVIA